MPSPLELIESPRGGLLVWRSRVDGAEYWQCRRCGFIAPTDVGETWTWKQRGRQYTYCFDCANRIVDVQSAHGTWNWAAIMEEEGAHA